MPNNIIDELSIKISAEAASALSAIDDLTSRLGDLSTAISSLNGVRITSFITPAATRQIAELGKAIDSFNVDKANSFSSAINALSGLGGGVHFRVSGFTALANGIEAVNLTKLRAIAAVDFSNFNSITEAGKSLSSLTSQLNKLDKLMKRVEKSQAALSTSTRSVSRETKKAHHSFSLANTAIGKLLNSIKRIAFYRAIRSAIRSVTQGFAEGIEHLYRWSQAWNTSFAPAMDQLATAQAYLKNGFASMFAPLIEKAIPIIDRLIDRLVDMFNVVQELFARLTGAETWNKAIKYPVKYKEDLDDAAGSAKALQNILMDFDEINAINTPTSGSRGSAKEAEDYSKMFELMETSAGSPFFEKFGGFFDDIKGKVNKALETVKQYWDFVKGLNYQPLMDSLDRLWNETLSPIIDDLEEDADWFREKVLQPITQFLVEKGIPASIDTLNSALASLWEVFKPIKDGLKSFWDENGEWIMQMLEEHTMKALDKIKEAFSKIGEFGKRNGANIQKIFSSLSSIFKKLSPFITKISEMIGTHAWDTFVESITDLFNAIQPVITAVAGLLELIDGLISGDGEKIKNGFNDLGRSILQALLFPIQTVLNALATLLDTFGAHEAAEALRSFSDNLMGIGTAAFATGEELDELQKEQDLTNLRIKYGTDSIEKEIEQIRKIGPTSQREFQMLADYTAYCQKYGLDPLTEGFYTLDEALGMIDTQEFDDVNTAAIYLRIMLSRLPESAREAFTQSAQWAEFCNRNGLDPTITNMWALQEAMDNLNPRQINNIYDAVNYVNVILDEMPDVAQDAYMKTTEWAQFCEKWGIDPLTGAVLDFERDVNGLPIVAQNASKGVVKQVRGMTDEMKKQIVSAFSKNTAFSLGEDFGKYFGAELSQKVIDAISRLATNIQNILGVSRAATIGKNFGRALIDNIQSSIRGINIPATVQVKALQNQITLDKKMINLQYESSQLTFANGGFPDQGSLFIAGEIPGQSEILGTIGGRTAVAGGEEITGIREAIYEQGQREEGLLRQLISAVANKDLRLVANANTGRWINQATKAYAGVTG